MYYGKYFVSLGTDYHQPPTVGEGCWEWSPLNIFGWWVGHPGQVNGGILDAPVEGLTNQVSNM